MSLNSYLSPSTWRILGLYIGTSYVGLGTTYILYPTYCARLFGFLPRQDPPSSSSSSQTTSTTASTSPGIPDTLVDPVMQFIAVRDISIGVAILTFWNDRDNLAMGKVILSGMLIAVVDSAVLFRLGRGRLVYGLSAGGVGWLLIGLGLVGW